ncbi:MAG: Mur ligase domain-containing protein [Actinomycetota bacterium]|nr:Mur ligase domain-containing protein [Actinomycetota bacterium]
MSPWAGRTLHFVGIGGVGMSGWARVARQLGATVSGSDRADGPALAGLRELGVIVHVGHAAEHVPAGAELIYNSAIPAENPERAHARAQGWPERPRAELLRELTALKRTIAVAGAHGKTTTTSMLAHALLELGAEPGYLIGGRLSTTGQHADWGAGEWLVVEADESDRSMLALAVDIAVVTNVELDHHATFGSLREVEEVFRAFLAGAPQAVLSDEPAVRGLRAAGRPATSFTTPDPPLDLRVPGEHNQRNAAAALEALVLAGFDRAPATAALATFGGAGRRFEELGRTPAGVRVVDDYAHHPTEVAAAIAAAREVAEGRVVVIFQPHLYSRTQALAAAFGAALAAADVPVVLDVYPARERAADFPQVTGRLVAAAVADARPGHEVLWLPRFADVEQVLPPRLRPDDLVLVVGAGDVDALGRSLVRG